MLARSLPLPAARGRAALLSLTVEQLWPNQVPMLDVRIEAQPASVWADFAAITAPAHSWEQILDRYGINYLVLHRTNQAGLASLAEGTGRWQRLYEDSTSIVVGRR
jgi:hypothetical protein